MSNKYGKYQKAFLTKRSLANVRPGGIFNDEFWIGGQLLKEKRWK